ncbi:hypothetical protein FB451DRAFT_1131681 [Mycena latifolia]|nr:hypothetical protein FB451DRAFT_1131681 [Mycena latifolia]
MSSENTPILASAIPAFELFIASWKAMLNDADLRSENIGNFIRPGLAIAEKYYNKMADTDAYIIAMCGPSFFQSGTVMSTSHLISLRLRTTGGQSLDDKVNHYMTSRLPSRKSMDMVGYWMVGNHGRMTWPKIFCLFADYTPIQAASVPSEQVFSSSVETDTTRRNCTNALLMEALQMLKFNFKRARLNFMAEWQSAAVPDEEEDWLRILASAADGRQAEIWREISDSCEAEAGYTEMPEEN